MSTPALVLDLPEQHDAGREGGGTADAAAITWIGNATVVVDTGRFRILTDPNFLHRGQHAALGGGLRTRRLHEPARRLPEILPVDLVLLSHHHGDHWDEIADRDVPKDLPIITTGHAARKLGRSGFRNTHPLDVWEQAVMRRGADELRITSLPAKHAPTPLSLLLPPVMGSMLELRQDDRVRRIYVSGDTLMHADLHQIPLRFPDIDLALVHLGGTQVLGILLTMDGEQGAEALGVIDPDEAIPVHYEEYTVMRSPLSDFEEAVARRHLRTVVHRLERGDTFLFDLAGGA